MAEYRPATPDQEAFREELVAAGHLIPSLVPGVYGHGQAFEEVRRRFGALVTRLAEPEEPECLRFPPILPRRRLEEVGYLKSFPHLAASVFSFAGTEADAAEQAERAGRHEDWSGFQSMTDLVLTPAACYPVYPAIAARGPLPPGGALVDTGDAYAFRSEPAGDPARLQMFHQRELVRIGEPDVVGAWRDGWRDRTIDLLRGLGLDAEFDVAADPFFGRGGRMLAANQRAQALKFEVLVPIAGTEPTALASFNYHQDHFAATFGIELETGELAHSACLGFGEERVVLALMRRHGLDVEGWPPEVRDPLWATA